MLELAGVKIERSEDAQEFAGIPWKFGPKIMLEPSFALTFKDLKDKFEGTETSFSARSTVILGGDAMVQKMQNLIVDGTVIARSKLNFFQHFSEDLITFVPVQPGDEEIFQIRGYKPKF